MTLFVGRHKDITSPKLRHQNDVAFFFRFQAPLLAKPWLRSCIELWTLLNFIILRASECWS